MATIIPKPKAEQVAFFQDHAETFAASAAAIGVTPGQAAAFKVLADAALAKWKAQSQAADAARSATAEFNNALAAAHAMAADLIRTVKAFAQNSGNPQGVYTLAAIPAPAAPTPAPAPGQPTRFTCTLLPTGELALRWVCRNPRGTQGTVYEVQRRIGAGPLTSIGITGTKKFTDETVPSAAAALGLTYFITAIRSTLRGPTAPFTVSFGAGGDGVASATPAAAKLAA